MYQVTAKLVYGWYHSIKLNLKILIFGDGKYPVHIRLQKIENQSTLVIQNKCEEALHTCSVVCIV